MTKEELERTWKNTAPNLSDENLMWIFNNAQQITESDQMLLKEVVRQVIFGEILRRGIHLSLAK